MGSVTPTTAVTHPMIVGGKVDGMISNTVNTDELDTPITLYPNPTNNLFNIQTELDDYNVLVTALDGRLVQQLNNLNRDTMIDASEWYNGVYFIRVIDNDSQQSKVLKLVKVN